MKLRWLLLGALVTLLLGAGGTVTAARLVDEPVLWWVRLVAFTPYATVLYLLALLLLVLACVRSRGRWRAVSGVLAVVALAGTGVHAYWARGPYLGPRAAATGARVTTHVMTSNLRLGRADTAQVVRLAVRRDVDVLVLEEVTPQAFAGLRRAGVEEVFAHVAGGPEPKSRGTMVFSKTPLGEKRRLDAGYGTYVTDVRLPGLAPATGGLVHLLAVHPQAPKGSVRDWLHDQSVIRRTAEGLSGPTVIVGDFNATMDHRSLRGLVDDGFQDAATQARSGWQPTWPSSGMVSRFGIVSPPLIAIDHVFVRDGVRAVRTETYDVDGTDHRALVAELGP